MTSRAFLCLIKSHCSQKGTAVTAQDHIVLTLELEEVRSSYGTVRRLGRVAREDCGGLYWSRGGCATVLACGEKAKVIPLSLQAMGQKGLTVGKGDQLEEGGAGRGGT